MNFFPRWVAALGLIWTAACTWAAGEPAARTRRLLDNNLKCVDLSDLAGELPLDVTRSTQILSRTEPWEHSTWTDGRDDDCVGYPTVVQNDRGRKPDRRYYLYYAHHEPSSGIGCAVARSIEGPYVKLAQANRARKDSQVLVCPGKPGDPAHYSSPCVVWNRQERTWFMYFHFYDNQWQTGGGHQRTALATCPDLAANVWTPWTNPRGELVPVLPVTRERWMNSQSTYHAIQQLPDARWLAFLRGTGGEYTADGQWAQDPCKLGFATSTDGRRWQYPNTNPVIHQDDGGGGGKGDYRPHFVGFLGQGEYLLCWSEGEKVMYGRTRDFRSVVRDPRGYAKWRIGDGLISPWREGDRLYLFAGKQLHVLTLPVAQAKPAER